MPTSAGTAYIDIVPRFQKFFQEINKATSQAGKGFTNLGNKLSNAGNKLTLGLTLPLVALGKTAFSAASDLNESMNKVQVVFGDSADAIVSFSKTSAKALGQSQQQALEAAGTFGNLFRALGTGEKPAADMSVQLVKLASDLASFNNASPEDVLLALRSGLVGEVEPLRKFGVSLSQARIEAEALATGIAKPIKSMAQIDLAQQKVSEAMREANAAIKKYGEDSIKAQPAIVALEKANKDLEKALKGQKVELTASQKAQAAYSIILKDTQLAQGDFARTADGAANKQRILAAQFKDASATIGQRLLPIGTKLLGFATDLFEKFGNLSPKTQDLILKIGLMAAVLGPVAKIGGVVSKTIGGMVKVFALARAAIVKFTGAKVAERAALAANNATAATTTATTGAMAGRFSQLGAAIKGFTVGPLGLLATGLVAVGGFYLALRRRIDATGEGLRNFRKATTDLATAQTSLAAKQKASQDAQATLNRLRREGKTSTEEYAEALQLAGEAEANAAEAQRKVFAAQREQAAAVGTILEKVFKPGLLDQFSASRGPDVMRQLAAAMDEVRRAGIPVETVLTEISKLEIAPSQKAQLLTLARGFYEYGEAAQTARDAASQALGVKIDFAKSEKAFSQQLALVDGLTEKYGMWSSGSKEVSAALDELIKLTASHAFGLARDQTALGKYTDGQEELLNELTSLKRRYPELGVQIDAYIRKVQNAIVSQNKQRITADQLEASLTRIKGLPPHMVKEITSKLAGLIDGKNTNFKTIEDRLKAIKNLDPKIRKEIIAKLRAELEASIRVKNIILSTAFDTKTGNEPPRQHGGPVRPGLSYLVGERGPELVRFNRPGLVYSNKDLAKMLDGGGGEITVVINNPKPEKLELSLPAALRRAELARARG